MATMTVGTRTSSDPWYHKYRGEMTYALKKWKVAAIDKSHFQNLTLVTFFMLQNI